MGYPNCTSLCLSLPSWYCLPRCLRQWGASPAWGWSLGKVHPLVFLWHVNNRFPFLSILISSFHSRNHLNYSYFLKTLLRLIFIYLWVVFLIMKWMSLRHVQLSMTPWTVACQAPLSVEFSRRDCWSRLPFPSPRDLPHPGIELGSPALQVDSLTAELPGKPLIMSIFKFYPDEELTSLNFTYFYFWCNCHLVPSTNIVDSFTKFSSSTYYYK